MSDARDFGTMAPAEAEAVAALLDRSFAMERGYIDRLLRLYGQAAVRVLRGDRGVAACLARFDSAQWFGGRLVPSAGIAVVAVEPESRGRGLSTTLLAESLRQMRRDGVAISTLFPSSYAVYRKAGYELAGSRCVYAARPDAIQARVDPAIELIPAPASEWAALQALHAERAADAPGAWERPELLWRKMLQPHKGAAFVTLARNLDGAVEGYSISTRDDATLHLPDVHAWTRRAARSLLAFLCGHGSTMKRATWAGGPEDPLAAELPPSTHVRAERHRWMLRIVDLREALERRGYSPALEASLSFQLRDDALPENAGAWTLDVAGGVGRLEQGGGGRLKLDARALAGLYGSELRCADLRAMGLIDGPREADALADLIFSGPRAWMAEDF